MKIIFLDVDGVLNIMSDSYRTFMKPYGQHIEPHLVERLNWLIKQTDASIVISSSWKSNMENLEKQMVEQGFKYCDRVLGRTPFSGEMLDYIVSQSGYRGFQIEEYIKEHLSPEDMYIVFDDEVSDICGEKCNAINSFYVVHVDMNEGLQHKDVVLAKLKLEGGVNMLKNILNQAEKDMNVSSST